MSLFIGFLAFPDLELLQSEVTIGLLEVPAWGDDELAELGYNPRHAMSAGVERRAWLQRRLDWPRLPINGKLR
ncbi:hypothetical protein FHS85_001488 [Rhodoligotrophos appendicifer]|uniref:hypothetical protein n=1 Tax=Rhodoligotrophos appendicifer TaxID=987056 RepID=UPI0014783469|nr:hypothetical protein [Rhodoligotrophos appendicifer]